jgi:hypothetical protein
VHARRDRGAVPLGHEGEHLLDLHDLLGRAAQKPQQRLAERLAEMAPGLSCWASRDEADPIQWLE